MLWQQEFIAITLSLSSVQVEKSIRWVLTLTIRKTMLKQQCKILGNFSKILLGTLMKHYRWLKNARCVFITWNEFVPYVDLISLLNCSQRERRHSLVQVTCIDKFVVMNCIQTLITNQGEGNCLVFISKINKGCKELQHDLCIIVTPFEHHHF